MIVVVEPLTDRVSTWRVLAGDDGALVGFIRRAADRGGMWVARTTGDPDGKTAAAIRRFPPDERHQAILWLAGVSA